MCRALRFARAEQGQVRRLCCLWRRERAPEFEEAHAWRACANVPRQHVEQSMQKAWPQRDVVFAQRISQLDRTQCELIAAARNQGGGASFGEAPRAQSLPDARFEIESAIGCTDGGENAPVAARDLVDPVLPNDLFDQIGFAFQVAPKTGNFPGRALDARVRGEQSEIPQTTIEITPQHRDAEELVASLIAQAHVRPGSIGASPAVVTVEESWPPASSRMSWAARAEARKVMPGSTPRSKR